MQANYSSYGASKLALIRFFEIMAAEYPDTHFVTYHPGVGEYKHLPLRSTLVYRMLMAVLVETEMHVKSKMEGLPTDTGKTREEILWVSAPLIA